MTISTFVPALRWTSTDELRRPTVSCAQHGDLRTWLRDEEAACSRSGVTSPPEMWTECGPIVAGAGLHAGNATVDLPSPGPLAHGSPTRQPHRIQGRSAVSQVNREQSTCRGLHIPPVKSGQLRRCRSSQAGTWMRQLSQPRRSRVLSKLIQPTPVNN